MSCRAFSGLPPGDWTLVLVRKRDTVLATTSVRVPLAAGERVVLDASK